MHCCHPVFFHNTLLPCGKCVNCRRRRINDWKVKVMLENLFFGNNSLFCTFTYDDAHIPAGEVLDYSDFQKFMKRLRRRFENIRYFCCEEYGTKFGRPHYHAIIFNIPYTSENINIIDKCWKNGFTCIKPLKPQNIGYVAKYCVKQFQKVKKYVVDDEEIEKCEKIHWSSGRVGGLGWRYFRDNLDRYFFSKTISVNGFNYSIPRSFFQKLSKERLLTKLRDVFNPEKRQINVLSNDSGYIQVCAFLNFLSKSNFRFSLDCPKFSTNRGVNYYIYYKLSNFLSVDFSYVCRINDFLFDYVVHYNSRFSDFYTISRISPVSYYRYLAIAYNYVFSHFSFQFVSFRDFSLIIDKNRTRAIDYSINHHFDYYDYEKKYISHSKEWYKNLLKINDFVIF